MSNSKRTPPCAKSAGYQACQRWKTTAASRGVFYLRSLGNEKLQFFISLASLDNKKQKTTLAIVSRFFVGINSHFSSE